MTRSTRAQRPVKPKTPDAGAEVGFSPEVRRRLRARLLGWYDSHRRELPWRQCETNAYAQLLAEFMLQQTQVSTVVDYYRRFVERYPTVHALAAASVDDVLTLWSGLGYYSRARNLHAAARQIVDLHGGLVPSRVEDLMELPGIGRYTAGAIASVAYDVRAPVLDGNVIRVLMRLTAMEADPKTPAVRNRLWALAESLVPAKRCGHFNQALMELGATVCTPRGPACDRCPVCPDCHARAIDATDRIPPTARKPKVLEVTMLVAAVRRGAELLFVQRPRRGLWAGLWELPTEALAAGESASQALQRLRDRLPSGCELDATPQAMLDRQLTHRRVHFVLHRGSCRVSPQSRSGGEDAPMQWLHPRQMDSLAVSHACRAIVEHLGRLSP